MTRVRRITLMVLFAAAVGAAIPTGYALGAGRIVAASKAGARKRARKRVRALLHKSGISKLPSVSSALAGRPGSTGMAAAVVGTPPPLVEIPGQPIKDLFWQPGVIDAIAAGSATPEQCRQYWAGTQDGESGGMGACNMAESVGYSFANILGADSSLCYMKRFPTPENVAGGGVSVVSGDLPGGDITRIFSVPPGAGSRVVKVDVNGDPGGSGGHQNVFLRVHGDAQNRAAGNFYKVDIWFCKGAPTDPASGYDRLTISNSGHLVDESADTEGGADGHVSIVDGYLTFTDGNVSYDTTRGRRARVESAWGPGSFKGDVEIRSDNTMAVKSYDAGSYGAQKGYVVNAFSGSGPGSLSFLAGAFKGTHSSDGTTFDQTGIGATEFRTSFYAAAPGSELLGQLDAVNLDTDAFYADPPAPSVDASEYACDETPDVELTLDFENAGIRAAVAECDDRRFNGMHFCHDDPAVQQADMNFWTTCGGPH